MSAFEYDHGELCCERVPLAKIADEVVDTVKARSEGGPIRVCANALGASADNSVPPPTRAPAPRPASKPATRITTTMT